MYTNDLWVLVFITSNIDSQNNRDLTVLDTALGYVRCLLHAARGFLKIQDEIFPKLCDLCGQIHWKVPVFVLFVQISGMGGWFSRNPNVVWILKSVRKNGCSLRELKKTQLFRIKVLNWPTALLCPLSIHPKGPYCYWWEISLPVGVHLWVGYYLDRFSVRSVV